MVSKAELKKRRVRAERADTHYREVTAPADRRRKRITTAVVVFLALMLVLPLAAGLISVFFDDGGHSIDVTDTVPTPTTEPAGLVDAGFEGAIVVGPTPCPATDGTEPRATQFSEPPPMCIGADETFTVELDTLGGPVEVAVDAALAPDAANLFVTLARYGVYDGAPIYQFPGVITIGGLGDAGIRVPGGSPPADGMYPVGSVVMLTDFDGSIEGQLIIVTDEAGSAALESSGQDPIIGTVTAGLESIEALRELQTDNEAVTYRVQSAAITSTG